MIFNIIVHRLKALFIIMGMMVTQRAIQRRGAVGMTVSMAVTAAAAAMVMFLIHAHDNITHSLRCRMLLLPYCGSF